MAELPKLRAYRKANRLSQRQLAALVGVDRVSVARWENGMRRVNWNDLRKLCKLTGLPPSALRPDLGRFFELQQQAAE